MARPKKVVKKKEKKNVPVGIATVLLVARLYLRVSTDEEHNLCEFVVAVRSIEFHERP
mgnify:CR=1 FL=1